MQLRINSTPLVQKYFSTLLAYQADCRDKLCLSISPAYIQQISLVRISPVKAFYLDIKAGIYQLPTFNK